MSYDPNNLQQNLNLFPFNQVPGQAQQQRPQQLPPGLNAAQLQQLNLARAGQLGGNQQLGGAGGVGPAHLQAMIAAMQNNGMQGGQMGQPQQQTFAPAQMQAPPQQQQQAGGQLTMATVHDMLRNGQLAPDQFNALAQQIAALQQRNVGQARPAQPQIPQNQGVQRPSQPQLPQQQHQQQQQFFSPSLPQAQQPAAHAALPPTAPKIPTPTNSTDEQGRIPLQILTQYMESMHRARTMQQRVSVFQNALQTGYLPSGADGSPAKPIPAEQKAGIENQLNELKRSWQTLMATMNAFQNLWTPARISADWQSHAVEQQAKQRALQGQQPQASGQALQPNQQQQQQHQQQLQQHQQQLQQQQAQHAAAQAAAAQAQATAQLPPQPDASNPNLNFNFNPPNPVALQAQLLQNARATKAAHQQQQPAAGQAFPQPAPVPAVQQITPQQSQQGKAVMPPLHLLQTTLDPKQFMQTLFELMRKRGEPITGTPYIEGREVDLYQLYQCVAMAGGSAQVNAQGAWHHIAKQLGWEVDITTDTMASSSPETIRLSMELAKTYSNLLKPYEEVWAKSMAKQRQTILEAAQRMNAPAPSTNKEEVAAMHARLAAAQQQQQQAKQAQAQLQQQQQQQQAAVPQPPPQQQGNAFANMTPQQLMAYGFNPTQVEYMRSQQQAEASATAGLAAATGDVKPPGPQRANSISSLKPQTTEPSLEQMSEARSVVNQLRMAVEGARPKVRPVEIPAEDRTRLATTTHQLVPLVKKVMEILPLFLAMTGLREDVKKIITFAALFNDQIRLIANDQFALDMSVLETLRGQFERCWNYVKLNHKAARPPTTADPTQAPPGMTKDQFSLMAQKNAGLRVEDLKPPPVKHRRRASGSTTSPAGGFSPSTPQNEAESPPKAGVTPRGSKIAAKGRGKKALDSASSPSMKTESPRHIAPSPAGSTLPMPVVKEEPQEPLPLKRKREAEEAANDPDGFIERTLKTFGGGASAVASADTSRLLAKDLTSHLPFDFNPLLPPVLEGEKTLSFLTVNGQGGELASFFANNSISTAVAPAPNPPVLPPLDWDFYIDSSAAGFDLDEAQTPELGKDDPDEASPPSDDEREREHRHQQAADPGLVDSATNKAAALATPSFAAPEEDGFDAWFSEEGFGSEALPESWAWEGELPQGSWQIHP